MPHHLKMEKTNMSTGALNMLFDRKFYIEKYSEFNLNADNALSFFNEKGRFLQHSPCILFDSRYYLEQIGEIENGDLFSHYLNVGWKKGLSPNRIFDTTWYMKNAEIVGQNIEPLTHFVTSGWKEGLSPSVYFNVNWYIKTYNPDLTKEDPLSSFMLYGWRENCNPNPLFKTSWYIDVYEFLNQDSDPLSDYLNAGWKSGRQPNWLFDPNLCNRLSNETSEPLRRYILSGGRNFPGTHVLFNCNEYIQRYPDVDASGINPLEHYIEYGWREGRVPHVIFAEQSKAIRSHDNTQHQEPIRSYLSGNNSDSINKYFDKTWYLEKYKDAKSSGLHPLIHYLSVGFKLNYAPNSRFNVLNFANNRPQIDFYNNDHLTVYINERNMKKKVLGPIWSVEDFNKNKNLLRQLANICNKLK